MPYLLQQNHSFYIIDSSPKNGVYFQTFPHNSTTKIHTLQQPHTVNYSACLDDLGRLHIACMPDAFQINYFIYNNNRFTKEKLIANPTENYELSDPILYPLQHQLYLIYLSHQTNTQNYCFVQQNLNSPNLSTLITCHVPPKKIKLLLEEEAFHFFFLLQAENYELNCLKLTENHTSYVNLLKTSLPIIDYSVCLLNDIWHIVYVIEIHGKYQLLYYNSSLREAQVLSTTQSPPCPSIFAYYNGIWINAILDTKLQTFLSMDLGNTFSNPVICSIQHGIKCYHYLSRGLAPVSASELYASTTNAITTPNLCILSILDFDQFFGNHSFSNELLLLIEGLNYKLSHLDVPTQTLATTSIPKESPMPAAQKKDLESAKSAFMDEFSTWNMPPKI